MSLDWDAIASDEQRAIFDWFYTPGANRHLVVRARAGCGKTSTIIEGVKRAPERSILIAAFSKDIALKLASDIGPDHPYIEAKTLHAIGYACVRRFRERINVSFNSDRANNLARLACGPTAPDAIVRLVSTLHTKGREVAPHAKSVGDLTNLAIRFECQPDESWELSGFGMQYVEEAALRAMELASDIKAGDTIDGSDMIFLPLRNKWLTPLYDLIVVDEAQDMTPAQLEIATGVLKPNGRICVVGDDRQAIFSFRGADSESLDKLKSLLGAKELGLKTTYRCARNIVKVAATLVPDFQAGPDNPDGTVRFTTVRAIVVEAGPGDWIVSRVNAPLVPIAMQLLRAGKRAEVKGREIGKGLIALIKKMKARSVPELLSKIETWRNKEVHRLQAQLGQAVNGRKATLMRKIDEVDDQAEMLVSLTDGAKNVSEVESRIVALFTDDGKGVKGYVTLSSVHRAKGQEADRVFVLKDTLRNTTVEEQNIEYVAVTRAKKTLFWAAD